MHRAATYVLLCFSLLSAVSCGGRKGNKSALPAVRDFPSVSVPSAITDADERAAYLTDRFWDAFLDTARVYPSAEGRLNGVPEDDLEQQVGNYSFLLQMVPLSSARASVVSLYEKMEAFQRKDPSAPVFSLLSGLLERYFYDPNSPVRNEDIFQALAARLAECPSLSEEQRARYATVAVTAALNEMMFLCGTSRGALYFGQG